jgi:hypothetical protein
VTNEELAVHLLTEQFKLVGLTIEQVKEMPREQFLTYQLTPEQHAKWHKESVDFVRKKKRWNKALAEKEVRWLDFQFGLNIQL